MLESDFFSLFTDRFSQISVEYMVTGSAAVIAYGEPRLTNDIDLVLSLGEKDIPNIVAAFPVNDFYVPPEDVLFVEIGRKARGHFNIIHHRSGLKADCYLSGDDDFQRWGLEHRKKIEITGHEVFFAPLEYVIIKKLQFYNEGKSEKHLRDIRSLLVVSPELINEATLKNFVWQFGLESAWGKAVAA